MLIYLDNNIIIDYEDGKKELPLVPEVNFVYSYTHIQELLEIKDNLDKRKAKRLQTIKRLTSSKYVQHNDNMQLSLYEVDPSRVLVSATSSLSKQHSLLISQATSHWMVDKSPKLFVDKLNIEKKVINNYSPEMLIEKYGNIIIGYIISTSNSLQEGFQSCFNILDAIGFWQDNINKGSTMNRSFDANHAYFATLCDYFVTNDRNTRVKSNVAYKLYGFKTKAVSYEEFIKSIENHNLNS